MAEQRYRWSLILAALIALTGHASGSETGPFLRLETGVHEAAINDVAMLPGGNDFVTVSDDKTLRIWSVDKLAAAGVIRPPLGAGDSGALYAVAASEKAIATAGRIPDGKPGSFGVALYLRSDLSSYGLIGNFPAPIMALRFSRSGRLLAVGMQGAGIRVLDLSLGRIVFRDIPSSGAVTGIDFDAADRLAVATDDGTLRVYGPDFQPLKVPPMAKGAAPWRIAFSPDGNQLAIGDKSQPSVHILDTRTWRFEADLHGAALNAGSLSTVAYAPDGKALYASGRYIDKNGQTFVRRFALGPRPGATDIKAARQLVTGIVPLDDGLVLTTADPEIVRLAPNGDSVAAVTASHVDFRTARSDTLRVSQDGTLIEVPGADGKRIRFDAASHAIVDADDQPLLRAYAAANGLGVTAWTNSHTPQVNGRTLVLEPAETARSVSVQANGQAAAIGTDYYLRMVGHGGELWRIPTEAPVWAVNTSGDNRLVIAALGDGTVHWYDAAQGKELLGLLLYPASLRFVLWTPQGFFDHDQRSDGAADGRGLVGYRFNTPSGRDSAFVEIGQLYPFFFRPDLVGLSLRNTPAGNQVLAEQAARSGGLATAVGGGLPARAVVLEACAPSATGCISPRKSDVRQRGASDVAAARIDAGSIRIRYRLEDAKGAPGTAIIKRNEAVIAGETVVIATEQNGRVEEATVPLVTGMNRIQIVPLSPNGAIEATDADSTVIEVERTPPPTLPGAEQQETKPVMYMLSVGVGNFAQDQLQLVLPSLPNVRADAEEVAGVFAQPSPPLYDRAEVTTLVDGQATRASIMAALRAIAAKASPDDMVVIFLAGHGESVDEQYYYVPFDLGGGDATAVTNWIHPPAGSDRNAAKRALFEASGLSQATLLSVIQSIPAHRFALILDTCFSAYAAADFDSIARRNLNETVTGRLGHSIGRFVLSGAKRKALDSGGGDMDEQGLFTGFLLRAFQGEADFEHSGMIDVPSLIKYTKRNVKARSFEMATKLKNMDIVQEPFSYFAGNDFFDLHSVVEKKVAN